MLSEDGVREYGTAQGSGEDNGDDNSRHACLLSELDHPTVWRTCRGRIYDLSHMVVDADLATCRVQEKDGPLCRLRTRMRRWTGPQR